MEIVKIRQKDYKEILKKTEKFLKEGRVIICPTDTVYGLICDATNKKAVENIFKIKKRPKEKAIPIFVKDIKMAKKMAFINKGQEEFLKKVWPGKVTVVLKRKRGLPEILFGKEKTVGLRIPNYKLINELFKKFNKPLTGTSANISGKPAITKIRNILEEFKKEKIQPDLVLNTGNLPKRHPSKLIDITDKKLKILRT